MTAKIEQTGTAWIVLVNSDLTEGRGFPVVKHVCAKEATAIRLACGASTQGSNGTVREIPLYKHQFEDNWPSSRAYHIYGPVTLVQPTKLDERDQSILEARETAIERARKAGLSDEDISKIRG